MTETLCRAGLILEGGGMRGVYTAGVLDCFLDEGLFFNRCYGVSAGAGQACSYLSRQRGRGRATAMDYLRDKRCASLWSLRRTGDYFGAEFLYDLLPNEIYPYDYDAFQAYTGTFYAVVTNCDSGEAEYVPVRDMRRDIIYVRASSSLPPLPRRRDCRFYSAAAGRGRRVRKKRRRAHPRAGVPQGEKPRHVRHPPQIRRLSAPGGGH